MYRSERSGMIQSKQTISSSKYWKPSSRVGMKLQDEKNKSKENILWHGAKLNSSK